MDFSEALKLLKQGRKIKREAHEELECIFLDEGFLKQIPIGIGWHGEYELSTKDLLADDWIDLRYLTVNSIRPRSYFQTKTTGSHTYFKNPMGFVVNCQTGGLAYFSEAIEVMELEFIEKRR